MAINYQVLYAYLVGQIDDTLQTIAGELVSGNCNRESFCAIGKKLKNALLTAEEMYLCDSDGDVE